MLKSKAKRVINRFGYNLSRYNPSSSEAGRLMTMLSAHGVNLVFDVGANVGQFARSLRDAGYRGRIVSFEPLSHAREKLKTASEGDDLWEIGPRAVVGDRDGEIEFHTAGNSVSSSALKMLGEHVKAAPESAYVGSERLPLRRLDGIGREYIRPDSVLFIKIDTQGFEHQVLQGARELLKRSVGLHLELLFVPLYQGQHTFDELISESKALGFEMWDIKAEQADGKNGRVLWGNGTFFRG